PKTLLGNQDKALARIRRPVPFVARQLAGWKLARHLANFIVRPTLRVIGKIEIAQSAVPPGGVVVRLQFQGAAECDHSLAMLSCLRQGGPEVMVEERVTAT